MQSLVSTVVAIKNSTNADHNSNQAKCALYATFEIAQMGHIFITMDARCALVSSLSTSVSLAISTPSNYCVCRAEDARTTNTTKQSTRYVNT